MSMSFTSNTAFNHHSRVARRPMANRAIGVSQRTTVMGGVDCAIPFHSHSRSQKMQSSKWITVSDLLH